MKDSGTIQDRCASGDIRVNDAIVDPHVLVKNGDKIFYQWTAIEPNFFVTPSHDPTFCLPHILHRSGDVVAVFKPSSLPTSPQGQYFRTNLTSIVGGFLGSEFLQPINRLDRSVGGIVLFSLNPHTNVVVKRKRYIAKVKGDWTATGDVICTAKLRVEKHVKNQVLKTLVDQQNGVPAETHFHCLYSSCEFSIIEARPITGRTHQIRAHLAHIGFPIVGDILYSDPTGNIDKQADQICLFSFEYSFLHGGERELSIVGCDRRSIPDWVPSAVTAHLYSPS